MFTAVCVALIQPWTKPPASTAIVSAAPLPLDNLCGKPAVYQDHLPGGVGQVTACARTPTPSRRVARISAFREDPSGIARRFPKRAGANVRFVTDQSKALRVHYLSANIIEVHQRRFR